MASAAVGRGGSVNVIRAARRVHDLARHLISRPLLARRILRRSLVVFLYHEVTDQPSAFNAALDLNVRPATFALQMDMIAHAFTTIGPDELASGRFETPAALVTFDDGNAGYFREAIPILRAKGIPSICFVNMATVRGAVCWAGLVTFLARHEPAFSQGALGKPYTQITDEDVAALLPSGRRAEVMERARAFRGPVASEDQLTAVADEPLVRLGNHLHQHRNAATLPPDRLASEYGENQRLIDGHPRGTRLFSYPFGEPWTCLNDATSAQLRRLGATKLFTAYSLPNTRHQVVYHRVAMFDRIRTSHDMYAAILQNYLRSRVTGSPRLRVN